jgi:hypothetical protein
VRRPESLCRATKADGTRCQVYAGSDGFCDIHGGRQDPRELGRKGGQARTRSVLAIDPAVADEDLRAQARRRLELLVNSEDERTALAAARALYSYGPQRPPDEPAPIEWHPDKPEDERDQGDVLRKLWEIGVICCPTCDGPLASADTVGAVVPHVGQTPPVVQMELLEDESEAGAAGRGAQPTP